MDRITKIWAAAHKPATDEVVADLPIVEGALPDDLSGVLYRNGPGRFAIGEDTYNHFFDGDGMILRFAIGAKSSDSRPRVRYRNAWVRTRELLAESLAGRMLYRGFGTNLPGGIAENFLRLRFKNAANTSVVYHPVAEARSKTRPKGSSSPDLSPTDGKLLALWEGGLPHLLDPTTLATIERADFDGGLQNRGRWLDRLLAPELPFSAHPKRDLETGDLYNFGVTSGPSPQLLLYKLDAQGRFSTLRQLALPHFAFVHDFCLTAHYFVFFICPVRFDEKGILLGLSTLAGSLQGLSKEGVPTRVLLVPRDGGGPIWQETSPCFVFHLANAYEDENGQVHVDGCRQPEYPAFPPIPDVLAGRIDVFPRAAMTRYTIDPKAPAGTRIKEEVIGDHSSELPTIAPGFSGRPHRYIWAVGPSRPENGQPRHHNITTSVVRHDTLTKTSVIHDFSEGDTPGLPGEPIFVRRTGGAPSETDGYILTVVYHGPIEKDGANGAQTGGDSQRSNRSALHVLDASDLSTICVALLPHHIPPGFHGTFVPAEACPAGWQT